MHHPIADVYISDGVATAVVSGLSMQRRASILQTFPELSISTIRAGMRCINASINLTRRISCSRTRLLPQLRLHSVKAMAQDIEVIILDSEDDTESPTAAAAREAAQRKDIMDFARAKRQRIDTADASAIANAAYAACAQNHSESLRSPPSEAAQVCNKVEKAATADGTGCAGEPLTSTSGTNITNSMLKDLHLARMERLKAQQAATTAGNRHGSSSDQAGRAQHHSDGHISEQVTSSPQEQPISPSDPGQSSKSVTLLSYNVWFREDVALSERMQGISDIITSAGHPTFICLQEVTPTILRLLRNMAWWPRYVCSPAASAAYFTLLLVNKAAAPGVSSSSFCEVEFDNSCMGRSLKTVMANVGGCEVLVATSHLESPMPPEQWFSKERKEQMAFCLEQLHSASCKNVLFAGDMNWTDSREGAPHLPPGWCDAWQQLHPGESGYTYDAANNPMLPHKRTPPLRLDRIFTRLSDFSLKEMDIVGKQQLEGATYNHTFRSGGSKELPVLPSDHFGLLAVLEKS